VTTTDDLAGLTDLGRDGWELVTMHVSKGELSLVCRRPELTFRERVTLDQRRQVYEDRSLNPPDDQVAGR
jgi:hypothetical protein